MHHHEKGCDGSIMKKDYRYGSPSKHYMDSLGFVVTKHMKNALYALKMSVVIVAQAMQTKC